MEVICQGFISSSCLLASVVRGLAKIGLDRALQGAMSRIVNAERHFNFIEFGYDAISMRRCYCTATIARPIATMSVRSPYQAAQDFPELVRR